jgi:hypothetical protein
VRAAFDGGSLTSDPGVLVLAEIVRRLGIADRLAGCLSDLRDPDRIRHTLAEIIRFRTLMIAAGYVTKMVALIKVSLPAGFVYRDSLVMLAARAGKLPLCPPGQRAPERTCPGNFQIPTAWAQGATRPRA